LSELQGLRLTGLWGAKGLNNFRKAAGISTALMVLFLLVQLITGSAPVGSAGAADARDISSWNIVTSATATFKNKDKTEVDANHVEPGDTVRVDYQWAVPTDRHVQDGDYYEFQLPNNVTPYKNSAGEYPHGELTSPSGDDYGKYVIDSDGTIRFTFNELAANSDDVAGDFYYDGAAITFDGTGQQVVKIPISQTTTQEVPITVLPGKQYMIDKSGAAQKGGHIRWTIGLNDTGQQMANPWVQEQMPGGLKFAGIAVHEASVNLDGSLNVTGKTLTAGKDFTYDDSTNVIKFIGDYANTSATLAITFDTELADMTQKVDTDFINQATLHYGDKTETTPPVDAHLSYTPHTVLEKMFTGSDGQTAKWDVQYTPGKSTKGATLTDTLDANQHFDQTAQVQAYIDQVDVNNQYSNGQWLEPDKDFTVSYPDARTMKITFNIDTTSPVEVRYSSVIDTPIPDAGLDIANTVDDNDGHTPKITEHIDHPGSDNPHPDTTPALVKKSTGVKDVANTRDGWTVDMNQNHEHVSNYWVQDSLPAGLTLDYDSVKLLDMDNGRSEVDARDYAISTTSDGFRVTLQNNLASTSDHYQLVYNTQYDVSQLPSGGWTNTVVDSANNTGHDMFTPPTAEDRKDFSYYPATKNFDWTITVNTVGAPLHDATVVDPIQSDQEYVADSVRVFPANLKADGSGIDPNNPYQPEVTSQLQVDAPSSDNNQTLTVHLPEGSTDAYIVKLETRPRSFASDITDPLNYSKNYQNVAHFNNGGDAEDLPATSDYFGEPGKLISKAGSTDGGSTVNWNVTINELQAKLTDVLVTDVSSANQAVDIGSITIKKAFHTLNDYWNSSVTTEPQSELDKPETLTLGQDYTVDKQVDGSSGQTTTYIRFLHEIDDTYIVSYQSHVLTDSGDLLNEANVTANEIKSVQDTGEITATGGTAGGTASGKIGQILLTKTDKQSGTKLAGAEFNLKSSGGALDRTLTTGDDGTLLWQNIPSGTYYITETKAPDGYDINPEYSGQGHKVVVNNAGATTDNPVTKVDVQDSKTGTVKLTKLASDTQQPLAGAHFTLYAVGSNTPVAGHEDMTTDANGEITVTDLPAGDYYFGELEAPPGYAKNDDIWTAVSVTAGKQTAVTVTNAPQTVLPHTGGGGRGVWLILGSILVIAGLGCWQFRKREVI
jgi:uncharacterized surface anchored protein